MCPCTNWLNIHFFSFVFGEDLDLKQDEIAKNHAGKFNVNKIT